jgi:membrane-bound metal-dependent hydrolase YbcI (DUF457 family)
MFIGHYAVPFAAKKAAPEVSLGTLFIASQFLDLIWPVFLLLGIETVKIDPGNTVFTPLDLHDYPYTHSLLMAIIWSLCFGGVYYFMKKNLRGAVILGLAVISHWILDFIVHRPDMPLYPGSTTYVGLGLWNSFSATLIIEGIFFIFAVLLYARLTRANDKTGQYAFWILIVLLLIIYLTNAFGPPPPDEKSIAWLGLSQWLFVPWMYWIDRHRQLAVSS